MNRKTAHRSVSVSIIVSQILDVLQSVLRSFRKKRKQDRFGDENVPDPDSFLCFYEKMYLDIEVFILD
jgi:hypothetical protein